MTHVNMTEGLARVVVGVDTHADTHVAAELDSLGRVVGRLEVPTTRHGYGRLLSWSRDFDTNVAFGIEGTGASGAGLARFLTAAGCQVAEITGPTVGRGAHTASPIRSTTKLQLARCWQVVLPALPRLTTIAWA